METKCDIIGEDPRFKSVVKLRVPGIYGPRKGAPLPRRMARLVRPAALALQQVYRDIAGQGGHLYITDMFRYADEQQRAHADYLAGRKITHSPPPCSSVHEAARAIDIDAFDTGIGHRRVRKILNQHGWINIVDTLTGPECWHYEYRRDNWQDYYQNHGYAAMARAMKEDIGNRAGSRRGNTWKKEVTWLQTFLNETLESGLGVDGIYGEETKQAVRSFQRKYHLQIDGVAGPITKSRINELLDEKQGSGTSSADFMPAPGL